MLQEVVDRTGWCGGNAVSLLIKGTGRRDAVSYETSPDDAATLRVTYDGSSIPASGGCTQKSIVAVVADGDDDAEESVSSGSMYRNSSDLELPKDGGTEQLIGMRFSNVGIPQGAIISSAYVKFQIDEKKTGSVSLWIHGENTGDSTGFDSSAHDISHRPQTSAQVSWPNLPVLEVGEELNTPDLTNIIQEIVDRGDWQSNNALSLFIDRQGGGNKKRTVESRNGDQAAAPKLLVSFLSPSGSGSSGSTTIKARDVLSQVVNDIKYQSGTPLVDAYYEAAAYMRGMPVDYGKRRGTYASSKNRVSHSDSWTGGTLVQPSGCTDADLGSSACKNEVITGAASYVSPMQSTCQTNQIVLLSDGSPSSISSVGKIKNMINTNACTSSGTRECGVTLATWLNETDHNALLSQKQSITTHTIGFNFTGSFLKDIADYGGGGFHEAASADQLVAAFQTILSDVLSEDSSFVAPGATVNQFNRLTHRNDIYFALFKPNKNPTWDGNLKRYYVGTDASTGEVTIQDSNYTSAVDPETGFFRDTSRSWWRGTDSSGAQLPNDGNIVAEGGAAGQQRLSGIPGIGQRNVYTYTGNSSSIPASGVDLTLPEHELTESNSNVTQALLAINGMPGTPAEVTAHRQALLKWSRGVDVLDANENGDTTEVRLHMGDPMHARPLIVNYSDGSPANSSVYVATNEGFLHSIDSEHGHEQFAFIPQELLTNLNDFYIDKASTKHPYGLDGSLSLWTDDINSNVMVDSGEEAYLYVGMRRGGSNYYALDVSSRLNPRLAWVIKGGVGGTSGFEELGESWSRPIPAKIMFNGSERQVVIFAAGYDEAQDTAPVRTADSIGRGLFIVDARTGSLIYSISKNNGDQHFAEMDYSIPSDIRIVDIDFDGIADQMYVGDMGGQVWRFDFMLGHSGGDLLSGGVIASLADSGTTNARRFFYEPDVAIIAGNGKRFLSVSIGSGWRAHPLDKVIEDRFYMLQMHDIYAAPAGYGKETSPASGVYVPMTEPDLASISLGDDAYVNSRGWFLNLQGEGQKVLAHSVTFDSKVVFTTYKPDLDVAECSPAIGGGSVFVINILDGTAAADLNGDGEIDSDDFEKNLAHAAIPTNPNILITEGGPIMTIGPEQLKEFEFPNLTPRTFWSDIGAQGFTSTTAENP